ncbi:MAG: tyrosine-type recombinase/integrase [Planctomycetaceae bacterium]|nr:tyrosine-type recombinase/integrase [Planctomycetaceae bacterium]
MIAKNQVKSNLNVRFGNPSEGYIADFRSRSSFTKRFPKYQIHKASNRAFVWWDNRRQYLGDANSPESLERYNQFIAEVARNGKTVQISIAATSTAPRVGELILAFTDHLKRTVCPEEVDNYRFSFRELRKLHAHTPADQFGPKALKQVRQVMIDAGLCRRVINHRIARIKRLFKFAVSEELGVSPTTYHALMTVEGLRNGQSEAREKEPIRPVSDGDVNKTLPYLSPTVAAMVQFQRLTGTRPAEACRARGCDFDMTELTWLYQLDSHKNQWRGKQRIIAVGPRAQEVLKPFLNRDPDTYLFRPEESAIAQRKKFVERISGKRTTKQYPSEQTSKEKRKAKSKPRRKYNEFFTTNGYRQAIVRAVQQAQDAGVDVSFWSPLQLRKTRATEIRRSEHGLEGAQVVLGHSKADVTQIYAERDLRKAIQIAQESG